MTRVVGYTFHVGDLFHVGHLDQLRFSKQHCNYLIVGVLTDKAAASYKRQPIIPYEWRAEVYAALSCVDEVVPQDSRDPTENLEKIRPDILFHGADWEEIPGTAWMEAHGGKVIKTPIVRIVSTTQTMTKIGTGGARVRNFAIISAGGAIRPDERAGRQFEEPRALMTLGTETVVGRLVRQCRDADIEPIISTGKPGIGGWTLEHIQRFEQLGCKLYVPENLGARFALVSMNFLLRQLMPDVEPTSQIFNFLGDWILTDDLFQEVVSYPAPCIYEFKWMDWGLILTGEILPRYLELTKPFEEMYGYSRFWEQHIQPGHEGALRELGFIVRGPRYEYNGARFVEIDWLWEYQDALNLVAREQG